MVFKEAFSPPQNLYVKGVTENTVMMPHLGILDQVVFKKIMINFAKVNSYPPSNLRTLLPLLPLRRYTMLCPLRNF